MSETNNLLRVDHVEVGNFRCFPECSLYLDPVLTVLVAENAQGKTALLDALALGLNDFVVGVARAKFARGILFSDIRLVPSDDGSMRAALPTRFSIAGMIEGKAVKWSRSLKDFQSRTTTKDAKPVRSAGIAISNRPGVRKGPDPEHPSVLPLVAYYGTGRLFHEHRLTKTKEWLALNSEARISAYLDCLSASSSYKAFGSWYGRKWNEIRDPRTRAAGSSVTRPEKLLAAVRKAVQVVLEPTGWETIDWRPNQSNGDANSESGSVVVEHPQAGRLPLTRLSDGVRNMVAMVGDLAHRCARLNPFFGEDAAERTPGVVLIDEIDMHLHPRWQQQVLGLLRSAFPLVQFVATTHSPHILTTLRKENIRIIGAGEGGNWSTRTPDYSPLGQESGDALAFVMGAHPRPQLPLLDDVQRFEQLARAGQSESTEAKAVLERLRQAGFEFTDAQKALFAVLAKRVQPPTS